MSSSRAGEHQAAVVVVLVVAELWPCLRHCHSMSWKMQTGSCALCVLAAESRLSVGSGVGEAPLYPTLAPSGSSGVGSNHCVPHPHGDRHPVSWRCDPSWPCPACSGLSTKLCCGISPLWWSAGGHHTACAHIFPTIQTQKCLPGPQSFELVGGTGGSPDKLQAPWAHPAQLQAVQ